jgi:membrane protease YdiL (CAAX protease family)
VKALYWTYGLSWGLALLGYALGVRPETPAYLVLGGAYMWTPGLVALLFARREGIRLPLAFRPNPYWLFAWLFPVPLTLLAVLLSLPFGAYRGLAWTFPEGPPPLPEPLLLVLALFQGMVSGAMVNLLVALGEELMWRGYLWERVRERGFWPATLEIGFHWGLWHAPLVLLFGHNYPDERLLGVPMMILIHPPPDPGPPLRAGKGAFGLARRPPPWHPERGGRAFPGSGGAHPRPPRGGGGASRPLPPGPL